MKTAIVNFGDIQIMQKMLARAADLVIAEIEPKMIRVGGDNQMHFTEIDYFIEREIDFPSAILPPPNEEEQRIIDDRVRHRREGVRARPRYAPDRRRLDVGDDHVSSRQSS